MLHINSFSFLFLLTEGLNVGVMVGSSDGLCAKFTSEARRSELTVHQQGIIDVFK